MSRTYNKWATGVSKKNKKGFTTGFISMALNDHISRSKRNTLDRNMQLIANNGLIDCKVIMCGDTPPHKWGKPTRWDCSDRLHLFKKSKKRRYRRWLQREEANKIKEGINEYDN